MALKKYGSGRSKAAMEQAAGLASSAANSSQNSANSGGAKASSLQKKGARKNEKMDIDDAAFEKEMVELEGTGEAGLLDANNKRALRKKAFGNTMRGKIDGALSKIGAVSDRYKGYS